MERQTIVSRRSSATFQMRDVLDYFTTWWRRHRPWLPRRWNLGSDHLRHDCDVIGISRYVITGNSLVSSHSTLTGWSQLNCWCKVYLFHRVKPTSRCKIVLQVIWILLLLNYWYDEPPRQCRLGTSSICYRLLIIFNSRQFVVYFAVTWEADSCEWLQHSQSFSTLSCVL